MNTIRDDFPDNVKQFFNKLQNYLDTDLYFYGSVNRPDYIPNKSDIDVAIFTDNEKSVMVKIQHFLHLKNNSFDKVVWKLRGKMIYGYKIKCEKYVNINCEIAVYNNDFKEILLDDMKSANKLPQYIAFLLFILKTLHYTFPIISSKTYAEYKRYLFNDIMLQKKDTVFYLLKSDTNN
jgi:hypothetical protein